MPIPIRPAAPGDGPALRDIEWRSGAQFRDLGMGDVADDEPLSEDALARYAIDRRSWVAIDDAERSIGYVLADRVDAQAHIEQVSVVPEHQGEGVGRALIDRVQAWAVDQGMTAITLTTFRDVPWNAPLYQHLGFRILAADEIGPELLAVRDAETAHKLDPAQRVCMRWDLLG